MGGNRFRLQSILVYAALFIFFGWIAETQGSIDAPPFAVIDRIVDQRWVVFLVGADEEEWIFPIANVQNVDVLSRHDAEGLWGRLQLNLQITECRREPFGHTIFEADFETTREMYDRMEAKIALLRARSSASLAFDHAASANPSSL